MAEKIIVLSDGTGNAASSVWRTNVWRIFQSLKLEGHEQVARYDDGVGTSAFKPLAILGGAFGYGLKRNVLESYKFICRNYQPGSKLYFFGFSRGAFTVRVLNALILQQGLIQPKSGADLHDLARKAYRVYRANGYKSYFRVEKAGRLIRDGFVWLFDKLLGRTPYKVAVKVIPPSIEFIGVWDTVAAYGLPTDEMTRGISDWIWPLELPNRVLHKDVLCARHAVALDDERTTFHPVLWTEAGEPQKPEDASYNIADQRLVQVWFTGMHANVGGGYPDDSLAFTPLYWLMREAKARGLAFKEEPEADPDTAKWMKVGRDPDGRLYDSRAGLGGYYRYGPRKVFDLCNDPRVKVRIDVPKIHESVFARVDSANGYAPIGLPAKYVVAKDDGTVLPVWPTQQANAKPKYESKAAAQSRSAGQDRLWNYVWMRRVVYFLTLGATFHLVLFWLFHAKKPAREFESPIRMVSEALRAAETTLPGWAHWWIDHYAANPNSFAVGVIVLVVLLLLGSHLSGKIQESMRTIWCSRGGETEVATGRGHLLLHWVRTSWGYQSLIKLAKFWLLPGLFAFAVVVVVITGGSHILFNIADSMGAYCKPSKRTIRVNLGIPQKAATEFETSSLCAPTGLTVREGFRYQIVIDVSQPWSDDGIETTPLGYSSGARPFFQAWQFRSGVLLRRIMWRPWFRAIARVGDKGVDEYFLDPVRVRDSKTAYRDEFVAQRSGEVFLYVNDAVIGLPWLSTYFYKKNHGRAMITLRLCDSDGCD